jgi:hypothetical protein
MSQGNDEELLLLICIPIIVVVPIILILHGSSNISDEIASLIWATVLLYALFVCLYRLYEEIQYI